MAIAPGEHMHAGRAYFANIMQGFSVGKCGVIVIGGRGRYVITAAQTTSVQFR